MVGDRSDDVRAHVAIPSTIDACARIVGRAIAQRWLRTDEIADGDVDARLAGASAIWCVPGSPYASMEGALATIRFARERGVPFLGTCGGFQHAVIEWARSSGGVPDADHAETNPDAASPVVAALACSLVGREGGIRYAPGSRLASAVGAATSRERYHCSYGISPAFRHLLADGPLRATAWDDEGDIRGVELDGHPFFVGTLFQPELSSTPERPHPIVLAFARAAVGADATARAASRTRDDYSFETGRA